MTDRSMNGAPSGAHVSPARGVSGVAESASEPQSQQLEKQLTPGQLTMMSLGGAIGAGLFVGSGKAVSIAGPAVVVAYLLTGLIIAGVMFLLGEMAAREPVSGAFSVFAERAFGRTVGAAVGWLYWLQLSVIVAAEAVGAAGVVAKWWPALGVGGWTLVFMIVFTALNLTSVKNYGKAEFWFASLKVFAIIAFLILGVALFLGVIPNVSSPGLTHLIPAEGFAPHGIFGIISAMLVVAFAFGGTEIAAIAAAETEHPAKSITRVVRSTMVRILLFYVGSLLVIVTVLPWNGQEVLDGPFAAVLKATHIPGADTIIAIVVVVALLSALNANLYGGSRMIFSLADRQNAPAVFRHIGKSGVPRAAVAATCVIGYIVAVVSILNPGVDMLTPLLLVIGSSLLLMWTFITLSFIVLRRRAEKNGERLVFRVPGGIWTAALVLAGLLFIMVVALAGEHSRVELLLTMGLFAVLVAVIGLYFKLRPDNREPLTGTGAIQLPHLAEGAGHREGGSTGSTGSTGSSVETRA